MFKRGNERGGGVCSQTYDFFIRSNAEGSSFVGEKTSDHSGAKMRGMQTISKLS